MTNKEFMKKIADIFGYGYWCQLTVEKQRQLCDLFEDIEIDAFNRGYDEGVADAED